MFTVQGAGTGAALGSTSDQFQYAFTTLTGDGSIVARLVSTQLSSGTGEAGIMIRDTLKFGF